MKDAKSNFDDMSTVTMKNRTIEEIQKDLDNCTTNGIDPVQQITDRPFDGVPMNTMLGQRRTLMFEKDEAAAVTKSINASIAEIDKEIMYRSQQDGGITQYKGDGITVSIVEQDVVKVDGDFVAIVESLVKQGYAYCIKKGLSSPKIKELDAQGVRLPDGVSIETFRKVKPTRTKKAGE